MSKRSKVRKKWIQRSKMLRQLVDHCVVCYSNENLHVHHLAYRPGGRGSNLELPEDMVVVCLRCHYKLHRLKMEGRKKFIQFRDSYRTELIAEDLDKGIPWIG